MVDYTIGAEIEFYLLSDDLLAAENGIIADLSSGSFPKKKYSISDAYKKNFERFLSYLPEYKIETECGPAQFEVQFEPTNSISELANKISAFREVANVAATRAGLKASFAAKPLTGHCGNSLHIHYSSPLFDPWGLAENDGVVTIKRNTDNEYVLWAIGGMLEKMPQDINIFVPTAESRKRIEAWFNAPTKICWGKNNRSTAIRIPDSKPKRIEHRVSGADANPHAVISAVVDAANYGIINKIQPDEPVFGNAWEDKYQYQSI